MSDAVSSNDIRVAYRSDTGRKRSQNEDELYVSEEKGAFLVVDGVGGEDGGEVAAKIASDRVRDRLTHGGPVEERVREGIALANRSILKKAKENPHLEGMACVLTLAILEEGHVTVGHVGDTRLYVVTPDGIDKKTSDHSFVGVLEEEGELTEGEAMKHPRRNEILREVGTEEHGPDDEEFIEVYDFPFESESGLVLCSDGLTDLLRSDEIQEIVLHHAGKPEKTTDALIEEANARGGKDNISVIVLEGARFGYTDAGRSTTDASGILSLRDTHTPESGAEPAESDSSSEETASESEGKVENRWWNLGYEGLLGMILGMVLAPLLLWLISSLQKYDPVGSVAATLFEVSESRRVLAVSSAGSGRSLREALGAAQPGDIIEVSAGTYRGPFHVKAGVSLLSREPHQALLTVPPEDSAVVVARNIDPNPYPTQLVGFRIASPDTSNVPMGVVVKNAMVTLVNLRVEGFARAGIEVTGRGSTPKILQSSIVDNPGVGVSITQGAVPLLRGNRITRNGSGFSSGGVGILVEAGTRPEIRNNIIAGNEGGGVLAYRRETESLNSRNNKLTLGTLQDTIKISSPE